MYGKVFGLSPDQLFDDFSQLVQVQFGIVPPVSDREGTAPAFNIQKAGTHKSRASLKHSEQSVSNVSQAGSMSSRAAGSKFNNAYGLPQNTQNIFSRAVALSQSDRNEAGLEQKVYRTLIQEFGRTLNNYPSVSHVRSSTLDQRLVTDTQKTWQERPEGPHQAKTIGNTSFRIKTNIPQKKTVGGLGGSQLTRGHTGLNMLLGTSGTRVRALPRLPSSSRLGG